MKIENIIDSVIKEGTTIAILDNKISSKEKYEDYFSGKWFDGNEDAENIWNELITYINKNYNIEVIEKEYPKINKKRRELTVGVKRIA